MGNAQSNEGDVDGGRHGEHHHVHQRDGNKRAAGGRRHHSSPSHANRRSTPPHLIPTSAAASTSTYNVTVSRSPASSTHPHSHARARSITAPSAKPPPLLSDSVDSSSPHTDASPTATVAAAMGQAESRHRPPSRSSTLPANPESKQGSSSPAAQPVDVPGGSQSAGAADPSYGFTPGGLPVSSPYNLPQSNYTRPPRLPLPIEEEVYTPGSPIITPQDLSSPLDVHGVEGAIPRRASVLSSTTVDEDEDVGEDPAFTLESDPLAPFVPTEVEWAGEGEKVFITGTFVNWERKFKMHKKEGQDGLHATLQLKPGTHHIKFLVDGNMVTSHQLPTTVDWTNILVNYIEVVAPLPESKPDTETQLPAPAVPVPIPGATISADAAEGTGEPAARPLDTRLISETDSDLQSTLQEPAPSQAKTKPTTANDAPTSSNKDPVEQVPKQPTRQKLPRPKYTNQLPDFLFDLDKYNDPNDERCQRALGASLLLPSPPSLPMFMSKSILNGATPHKDDASVLIMPNHTVLNHLATSSIKSGVLATSGTTRYKRKFLTTIMYKPTSSDDG